MRGTASPRIRTALRAIWLGLTVMGGPADALAQAPTVHPLSEILSNGPAFEDLTSTSVTVRIETAIVMVCAAAYGTTTAYGSLATDGDMAAGGHTSHHPALTGLTPDTDYQLRLQGIGPDGTLYVSDNYSFHTPKAAALPQAATRPPGSNVALSAAGARVVAVSSNYGGGGMDSAYGGDRAIDGDAASQWSSNGDGDKAWIEIDLGKPVEITAVGLQTRTMGTSAQIESFRVITDAGERFGPFSLPDARYPYYFPVAATARLLRFEVVSSSGGNTGAATIEVFGR